MMLTAAPHDRPLRTHPRGTRRATAPPELSALAGELTEATDTTAVWRALFRYARATTRADSILVALFDPDKQERVCVYLAEGDIEEDIRSLPPMPLNDGPQSMAIRTGEPIVTNDLGRALKGLPQVQTGNDHEPCLTRSSLAVPIRARGELIGAVEIQSYQRAAFQPPEGALIQMAAGLAAIASDNLRVDASARHRARLRTARRQIAGIIAEGAFQPVYQPIVDLETNRVVGYEALTRFTDGGAPDDHFAAAEAAGLGLELETATLRAALEAARDLPTGTWLAVNASPRLVLSGEPLRGLIAAQRRRIVLEVTEHTPIGDYQLFKHALRRLPRGIDLSIDDAGAGYASFRHILELRPRFVKLSREFIRRIDGDPARQALVQSLVSFAAARGSLLVAEGLESKAELAAVQGLEVPLGQGYLLGRPAPAASWAADGHSPDRGILRPGPVRGGTASAAAPRRARPSGSGRTASGGRQRELEADLRRARAEIRSLREEGQALRAAAEVSEQRYAGLVQRLDAVVWEADGVTYRTTFVSERAADVLGYPPEEYLADPDFWENHVHPDDREQAMAACDVAIEQLSDVGLEYRFRAADGRYLWIADRVRVTSDGSGQGRRLTGVMIDISERKRLEEQLARQAFEDVLTGLPNRALFMDRLGHALTSSRRTRRRPAVLFLDLDGLKLINDTLGHEAGDEVLREVGRRLAASGRAGDTVARLAGDEFTILIEDVRADQDAREVATRFAARVRAPIRLAGGEVSVTASVGIAFCEAAVRDPEELVRRADIAMYGAKRDGKDRIVVYEASMAADASPNSRISASQRSLAPPPAPH